MPPLYDNINDAFELLLGGAPVTLTNVGATFETNDEFNGPGNESVWLKIDLSSYPEGLEIPVEFSVSDVTGTGFHPYLETMAVIDPTFDPSAPDFAKLGFISGGTYGDGTATPPPQTVQLVGGAHASPVDNESATGLYYVYFTDWDYDGSEGSALVSYEIPEPPICIDAVDVINPDSPTATVVSGRVSEGWDDWWSFGRNPYNWPPTLVFTWSEAPGQYKLQVLGQMQEAWATSGSELIALAKINGRPYLTAREGQPESSSPYRAEWFSYEGYASGADPDAYDPEDYAAYPWLPLNTGDTVEIMILSSLFTSGFAGFNPFEVEQLCFFRDENAPATTFCTPGVKFLDPPIGDEWGDENGWGFQRLIPDEIWDFLGYDPDTKVDGVDAPWIWNVIDYDFVAMDDGTLYVIYHDSFRQSGDPTTPGQNRHFAAVKKYDPGTDSWSQIATLNINDPTDRMMIDGVTCERDPAGDFVYFCWWELATFTAGTPNLFQWEWHVKRLDVSDDSITELGTGQNAVTVGSGLTSNHDSDSGVANQLVALDNGDVYVSTVERINTSSFFDIHPFVWRWDGAAWSDLAIPDPTVSGDFEVVGENQFWDQLVIAVAADATGPRTDAITVCYCLRTFDSVDGRDHFGLYTNSFVVGSGWTGDIVTDIEALEGDDRTNTLGGPGNTWGMTALDMTLVWSENLGRLILVADLGSTFEEIWDMFQMAEDGSDWELLPNEAPPSSAGPWRQARNSAAIGPDGNIWRGMISDVDGSVGFEPHVLKHSPGFGFGYTNASQGEIGHTRTPYPATVQQTATANCRIRVVGQTIYLMGIWYAESMGFDLGEEVFGEGVGIFKGTYVPCRTFRPQIYRRILG